MKVLFNTHPYNFQNPGGGETVLMNLHRELQNQGVEVDLFNPWNHKMNSYDIIHEFHCLQWRWWDYYQTLPGKFVLTPTLNLLGKQKKIIDTLKSVAKELISPNTLTLSTALNFPDLILPTTDCERIAISDYHNVPLDKMKVLFNGITTRELSTRKPRTEIKDYFLFVGNISPVKRLKEIIKACIVANQKLVIVGNASAEHDNYLKDCIELARNHSNIEFYGKVDHNSEELDSLYFHAKALIVFSKFETFSMVGIEAGMQGTPIIMIDTEVTREVYQDFAHYVSNEIDLEKKLHEFYPKSKQENFRNFIKENYSIESIATKLSSYYRDLLKQ